jgi:hypothetical protein
MHGVSQEDTKRSYDIINQNFFHVARFSIHPKAPHRITKEERDEHEKPGAKSQHQSHPC